MTGHLKLLGALTASGLFALSVMPAKALTAQECSAKYKAAKSAGTLNGQKWNDFRKAHCRHNAFGNARGHACAEDRCDACRAGRQCGLPVGGVAEICQRVCGQGA